VSILIALDVTVPNCFPHVPHQESYPYHRGSLDVVGLGEGRPPAADTDIPDNGLDPMLTMVPIRGGRVAPPVKTMISVDPDADVSMPVWAATTIWRTVAARGPTRSAAGAFTPVWAAATAPLGCAAAHCAACSRTASLASLSSLSLSPSAETELPVLLALRASSSAASARAASAAAASALAAVSSAIASLAAVVAVSAAARSRSSVAATSSSCRCCALEAIER
jgi:hypothetical protein